MFLSFAESANGNLFAIFNQYDILFYKSNHIRREYNQNDTYRNNFLFQYLDRFHTIKIKLKMCFVTKSLTFKQLGPRHAVLSAREDWL